MFDRRISAVIFDLGDTLLNFGRFKTFPLIRQGAMASYDYLASQGQSAGKISIVPRSPGGPGVQTCDPPKVPQGLE